MGQLVFLVLLLGLMYFMVILPQRKRLRAQQALLAALAPGDRVLTAGGIYGTIAALDDDLVVLTVAPGVDLQLARGAISRRLEPMAAGDDATTDIEDRP